MRTAHAPPLDVPQEYGWSTRQPSKAKEAWYGNVQTMVTKGEGRSSQDLLGILG